MPLDKYMEQIAEDTGGVKHGYWITFQIGGRYWELYWMYRDEPDCFDEFPVDEYGNTCLYRLKGPKGHFWDVSEMSCSEIIEKILDWTEEKNK